jgi:hypothetical protein
MKFELVWYGEGLKRLPLWERLREVLKPNIEAKLRNNEGKPVCSPLRYFG